jgi:hypothetical protein
VEGDSGEGEPIEEDGTHHLVSAARQAELLTASFDTIKGRSGEGKHDFDVKALFSYDIEVNYTEAKNWANHCGLRETSTASATREANCGKHGPHS